MYFPARDGTASATLLSARPGLQFCSRKDETLFKKTQARAFRPQIPTEAIPSAQELCIQTVSWRLALAYCPCSDVLARHGDCCHHRCCTLPQLFPWTAPVSHQWANGQTGQRREGLVGWQCCSADACPARWNFLAS